MGGVGWVSRVLQSCVTSKCQKSHEITECADDLIKSSRDAQGFLLTSVAFFFVISSFFFLQSSAVQLPNDVCPVKRTTEACQCSAVRLSFICQSKLVRPYQRARGKGNGNDLLKPKLKKRKRRTVSHLR